MKKKYPETEHYTVDNVALSLIDTEGQSVRAAQDDDHVVELSMSIVKHGLLEPIVVRRIDEGGFQLLAGFHRLAAFYRLQRSEIPAHIIDDRETPIKAIALIENIVRRDLSLKEEVEAVTHLNTDESLSASQICDLLGKSRQWVDRRLMIPNLPPDVSEQLMDGRISIGHAEVLGNIESEPIRKLITNQTIQNKLTVRETEQLTGLYFSSPQVDEAIEEGVKKARELSKETPITKRCECCGGIYPLEQIYYIPVCRQDWAVIQQEAIRQQAQGGN